MAWCPSSGRARGRARSITIRYCHRLAQTRCKECAMNDVETTGLVLSSSGEAEQLVRAHGARFVVTDMVGDIKPLGARELGFFVEDTRYLSHYAFHIEGLELVHLSSETRHDAFN